MICYFLPFGHYFLFFDSSALEMGTERGEGQVLYDESGVHVSCSQEGGVDIRHVHHFTDL